MTGTLSILNYGAPLSKRLTSPTRIPLILRLTWLRQPKATHIGILLTKNSSMPFAKISRIGRWPHLRQSILPSDESLGSHSAKEECTPGGSRPESQNLWPRLQNPRKCPSGLPTRPRLPLFILLPVGIMRDSIQQRHS